MQVIFPKIQSANTNRRRTHRHSRIDNHSLRWHRTEPHPRRRHETTFWEKHIHIWSPSFFFVARAPPEKNRLFMSSHKSQTKLKLSCNWDISTSRLLKNSQWMWKINTFSVSVQNPRLFMIGTEHEQNICTFPHIRNHSIQQESVFVPRWNIETHKYLELPLLIHI